MKITFRIWVMLIILALSLMGIFSIPPKFLEKGVVVTYLDKNSTLFEQGLRQGDVITLIENTKINSLEDYNQKVSNFIDSFGSEETKKITISTKNLEIIYPVSKTEFNKIQVEDIPNFNIKTGLDIRGGVRAIISAENKSLSDSELSDLISISQERLNVYGLSDLDIRKQVDLSGNRFMIVSIAGSSPSQIDSLLAQQGNFEAKIGNETVFSGGNKDIPSVCRNDAKCALVESCQKSTNGGYFCNFRFSIYLSESAAERHANITNKLSINQSAQGSYLSEKLDLFVDGILLDSLLISSDLKGRATTQISISGSGSGATEEEAYAEANDQMKKLQIILITGSLPFKLKVEKIDRISPSLGQNFSKVLFLASILAFVVVFLIIYFRYRDLKLSSTVVFIVFAEIAIILGISSFIKWNLDLASIAGIIAAIGTGVDDQIVLIDESSKSIIASIKQRIKNGLFIVFTAYATAVVSLLPLYWAGAGLLRGFAVTSLIGITAGVLITRPAFAEIAKQLQEQKQ